MEKLKTLSPEIKQYILVTGNYWAFTLTDGALRMLVVLHFHELGYSPLDIALLFLFYEFFGVVTNLVGGWIGAHIGLNRTMNIGLGLQVFALSMLLVPSSVLTVPWVMAAQALSGIAKDLNKMSAKSAVKLLIPGAAQSRLYRLVALLTGSKNTLKGIGFFMGGALLSMLGFSAAVLAMAAALALVWLASLLLLKADLGKASSKPRFTEIFSKSAAVNRLSAARLFLFAARDVWFVIALPVYLASVCGWSNINVGSFLALWIIGYGGIQVVAPAITRAGGSGVPDGRTALWWAVLLSLITLAMAFIPAAVPLSSNVQHLPPGAGSQIALLAGLLIFGGVFAVNSSLHSYLIVSYANEDGVSLDVGFYYMANAMGRLLGTVLSGWLCQKFGLVSCLLVSATFVALAALLSIKLPRHG